MSDSGSPPTGSVSEEAVKLLQALQGWAVDAAHDQEEAAGAAAAGIGKLLHDVNEHIATDTAECLYCPVCKLISAVRGTTPEVKQHLTVAASSLLQAAAGLMATRVPDANGPRSGEPVEHIDLSDGAWEED